MNHNRENQRFILQNYLETSSSVCEQLRLLKKQPSVSTTPIATRYQSEWFVFS